MDLALFRSHFGSSHFNDCGVINYLREHVTMPPAVAEGSESTHDSVRASQDAVLPPDDSGWEHIDTTFERGCI